MRVTANGKQYELARNSTLAALLETLEIPGAGVAVALNGSVVPRAHWSDTVLSDGAEIEVLTAVQGG
jgi:sulfur carrier protein